MQITAYYKINDKATQRKVSWFSWIFDESQEFSL